MLLKWPQNKMASNIAITEKKKNKTHISYILEVLWNKVTDIADEPVVQCDVPAAKNTSLDDGNNDDCKNVLITLVYLVYCFWN